MKIGKRTVKGLTEKETAGGIAYYWQPDPRERKAGWKGLALGSDLGAAVTAADKRNEEIAAWKNGGAKPRAIARFTKAATFGALLDRYEREKLAGLSENAQRVDQTQLNRLREWAGDQPIGWITRARVRVLKLALCPDAAKVPKLIKEGVRNIPGHSVAFKTLAKGREIFGWYIDEDDLSIGNPFERFGLPKPPPRDQIWDARAQAYFTRAAIELDGWNGDDPKKPREEKAWPSIGFALRIACYYAQREADVLKLTTKSWQEISLLQLGGDQALYDALASDHGPDAGKVMGLYVNQNKGKRWVGVPFAGDMRDEIEATIAAAKARMAKTGKLGARHLIAHDETGEAWGQRDFIEKVGETRARAARMARADGDEELAKTIEDLEFRDTRRTCVVMLGNLGLDDAAISARTGHRLGTIKQILEVYMPRTETMAGRGTVAMLNFERRDRPTKGKPKEESA